MRNIIGLFNWYEIKRAFHLNHKQITEIFIKFIRTKRVVCVFLSCIKTVRTQNYNARDISSISALISKYAKSLIRKHDSLSIDGTQSRWNMLNVEYVPTQISGFQQKLISLRSQFNDYEKVK